MPHKKCRFLDSRHQRALARDDLRSYRGRARNPMMLRVGETPAPTQAKAKAWPLDSAALRSG